MGLLAVRLSPQAGKSLVIAQLFVLEELLANPQSRKIRGKGWLCLRRLNLAALALLRLRLEMNLIFRMLYVLIRSLFCERIGPRQLVSELSLRVLPNDIDINFHMNNGRYLTICDLNRVDIFARSGLLKAMFKRNWLPVIAEHTMTYKKPLNILQRFKVRTEVTQWDEKYFYMTHSFIRGDRIVAEGTSKGCVYARGVGVVKPDDALAAMEQDRSK